MTEKLNSGEAEVVGLAVEKWIDHSALGAIAYSQYWNDEEIEKAKELHVLDRGFEALEAYVKETGLVEDLAFCLARLRAKGVSPQGVCIDVASGMLWMLPSLFKALPIDAITCIDYSYHRLLKIGPKVVEHYRLPAHKITLALGSFYDIRISSASADFALLCQALHHADRPVDVLHQLSRVLKPGGIIIILGEPVTRWTLLHDIRHTILYFMYRILPPALQIGLLRSPYGRPQHVVARSEEVFKSDPVLGDHFFLLRDYRRMFTCAGFGVESLHRPGSHHLSLIATKKQ